MRPNTERIRALRKKWPISLAVPSAVFSATLPVKPSVTTTSAAPAPISSPSTKPQKSMGSVEARRICAARFTGLDALHVFLADVEDADGRPFDAEDGAGERLAHHRKVDKLFGFAFGVGADVEHHGLPAHGRPKHGDGRARDAFDALEHEERHRHQRAGVAGARRRHPPSCAATASSACHMRGVAAAAHRLARLFLHAARCRARARFRSVSRQRAMTRKQRLQHRLVAVDEKPRLGMTAARNRGTRKDGRGAGIAAHGINRKNQFPASQSTQGLARDMRAYQSLAFKTSRSLYCPHWAHTWCGRFNSPQFGHSAYVAGASRWCERRMFRREGEVFLLGTAMFASQSPLLSYGGD